MIAVYGATGYTGRLVAAELQRRGLTATLCGRSLPRLEGVARSLGVDWPVRAAAIDDAPELRRALLGADVVINCAGPFTFYGAPVIEAALDVGAHYCDTTGEQPYMQGVFRWLDGPARERGRAVVPAVGFDVVPGDLAASLAAAAVGGPLASLDLAYLVSGFSATRGTLHSALEMLKGGDAAYVDGDWRPAPRRPERAQFAFPSAGSELVLSFPAGEVATVPRHVQTRAVRTWLAAAALAPHPRLAPAAPASVVALGPLLRSPLAGVVHAVVDRLPEGPGEDARRSSSFTIVADARGVERGAAAGGAQGGASARAVVHGTDAYAITATIAVEFARRMASADFAQSGALAPAQVVDAEEFLGWLGEHGVRYEVERPGATAPTART